MINVPNSTPTVTSWSSINSLVVTRYIRHDLPTAESPMIISLKRQSDLLNLGSNNS